MRALIASLVLLSGCVYNVSPGYDGGAPDAPWLCSNDCRAEGFGCCGVGACVDHETSWQHCGACGVECAEGEACQSGACVAEIP